jgi:hypothetical protein
LGPLHPDLPTARAPADPYASAMARADQAETSGDLSAAVTALMPILDSYPQDYALPLRLGWLSLHMEQPAQAERFFRIASARAPAAPEPRVGLASALVLEDSCSDAMNDVARVVAVDFGERHGISTACTSSSATTTTTKTTAEAAFEEALFPDHPTKASATGAVASTDVLVQGGWEAGAAYRYMHVGTRPSVSPFDQHEAYAQIGYERQTLEGFVQGAVISDGSGLVGTSVHAGATVVWRRIGDLALSAAGSFYRDMTVGRLEPSWQIPAGPLRVVPAFAVESAAGRTLGTAMLGVKLEMTSVQALLGGKYGDEVRPAYLVERLVYDITEDIAWGLWAGLRVRSDRSPVGMSVTYSFDRLRRRDVLQPAESNLQAFAFGTFVSF